MQVHVTTDNHIRGSEELVSDIEVSINAGLKRFASQITRVEVHLADENSHKTGTIDKRCTLEARVAGLQAVAASASGGNVEQAVAAALDKLVAQLDHKLGRLGQRKGRAAMGDEPNDESK
jgi:ribosome-associated translation inhibitor RaiA